MWSQVIISQTHRRPLSIYLLAALLKSPGRQTNREKKEETCAKILIGLLAHFGCFSAAVWNVQVWLKSVMSAPKWSSFKKTGYKVLGRAQAGIC
jgi:hypothetical protein